MPRKRPASAPTAGAKNAKVPKKVETDGPAKAVTADGEAAKAAATIEDEAAIATDNQPTRPILPPISESNWASDLTQVLGNIGQLT